MQAAIEYVYSDAPHSGHNSYLLPAVIEALKALPNPASIADFGCGDGEITEMLARPGRQLTGLDNSTSGIERAQRRCPSIEWHCADLTGQLPPLGPFDAVVSLEVIEHVYSPRDFIGNCYRALKPGGTVVLSTPYHGYLKNLIIAASGKMDAHFNPLWDHGHIKFWSHRTLTALLSEAGFERLSFHGVGRCPLLWKSIIVSAVRP